MPGSARGARGTGRGTRPWARGTGHGALGAADLVSAARRGRDSGHGVPGSGTVRGGDRGCVRGSAEWPGVGRRPCRAADLERWARRGPSANGGRASAGGPVVGARQRVGRVVAGRRRSRSGTRGEQAVPGAADLERWPRVGTWRDGGRGAAGPGGGARRTGRAVGGDGRRTRTGGRASAGGPMAGVRRRAARWWAQGGGGCGWWAGRGGGGAVRWVGCVWFPPRVGAGGRRGRSGPLSGGRRWAVRARG